MTGRPPRWQAPLFGTLSADEDGVHAGAAPVNKVRRFQPRQQVLVELLPDLRLVPIPQPAPAGHARAAAHLPGQHLPGDAAPENEEDA